MKDTLQRILFYLRYEMTEYVRTRIELSVLSGLILLFLGFIGYQAHEWYRLEKEIERHEAILQSKNGRPYFSDPSRFGQFLQQASNHQAEKIFLFH